MYGRLEFQIEFCLEDAFDTLQTQREELQLFHGEGVLVCIRLGGDAIEGRGSEVGDLLQQQGKEAILHITIMYTLMR